MSATQVAQQQQVAQTEAANTTAAQEQQVNVLDVEVKDENTALNIMVTFLNAAQRRGAYSMPESAKLWECIRVFQKQNPDGTTTTSTTTSQ
tara:strand:+ start:689 stop:961 length:273 start_codon:yes stop_codon:yes gene_type:complete